MYDSDTGTIMAKVHEYKRKAHDCATRRTPSQLALLLKAVHLLAARCKIWSPRRATSRERPMACC